MYQLTVFVTQYLDLDVAGIFYGAFGVNRVACKGIARFEAAHFPRFFQILHGMNDSHTASAPAGGGLQAQGETNLSGPLAGFCERIECSFATRDNRRPRFLHGLAGQGLVAHPANGLYRRTNKFEAARLAKFGKICIFRQRSVARMNGVCMGQLGGTYNIGDILVTIFPGRWSHADIFFSMAHVQGIGIGL